MGNDRSLHDSECLYDYYTNDDGSCPVLVIRDLGLSADTPRCRKSYRSVSHNTGRVIAEIGFETGHSLDMAAAIYRDATGRYKGIDLIGENREIFDLRPEQHITDEDTAIAAAREIHGKLLAGLDEIKSCLSAGRIEQFSFVELHFDGTYHSFWIPGYPSKEEIERSEPYLEMRTECPDAKCIVIEVVSRLIYQEAAPASNALMYVLTNLGFERANRLGNVFIGQSDRYEEIRN